MKVTEYAGKGDRVGRVKRRGWLERHTDWQRQMERHGLAGREARQAGEGNGAIWYG